MGIQINSENPDITGSVFDVQHFAIHDGPGIRTLVFLKGCPLCCQWCANPESLDPQPDLGFFPVNCNLCGKCFPVCTSKAIIPDEERIPNIDRNLCDSCGECVKVCIPQALIMYGRRIPVSEVFTEVQQDLPFYIQSGGGVTVSGGEPLQQPAFVKTLFRLCREAGIHTALETSGFAPAGIFREIIAATDYIFFDIKCISPELHRRYCGQDNALILENAGILSRSGIPFMFRLPLVPGINDDEENLKSIITFLKGLKLEHSEIEVMPYHRLGVNKYASLGKEYLLQDVMTHELAELEAVKALFTRSGITCYIDSLDNA
ncbi:MAG: glycyl-radical enzyme activating protein [Dehalococcoidales bacterium]|nr:glycyl-radical enzyme activating protein [Dehalococcoidales bacterium]